MTFERHCSVFVLVALLPDLCEPLDELVLGERNWIFALAKIGGHEPELLPVTLRKLIRRDRSHLFSHGATLPALNRRPLPRGKEVLYLQAAREPWRPLRDPRAC